ncbi:MAG TPA: amidophosphoribosyltransferase [Myxococcota bacterium]|nr:amidophosphoribosyltransferase [Myxococcota bacterium]
MCGIVGIHGHDEAAKVAYLGLHALQHRGQEGAGISTWDGTRLRAWRGLGLVGDVYGGQELDKLPGTSAIGHVRYSTSGESSLRNVQPFVVRYREGQVAIAHNGNLVNAAEIRGRLEARGSIFATSSDTEVILHLVATSIQGTFINRLVDALMQVEGAYSLVLLSEDRLVAVRDPMGFRPLVLGRLGDAWIIASETTALDLVGGTVEREVEPGEMIIIEDGRVMSLSPFPRRERKSCVFEHVYFARPNSDVFSRPVYDSRFGWGRRLARSAPVEADVALPVPDSGTPAALGYAFESKLTFKQGLIRSHYVGRTFIEPSQQIRDFGVKLKLSPVRSVIEGKRLVVIDDSIVRGTTSRKIVRLLRAAGAAEVHLRICSPPIIASCFYGVDTPTQEELIAHRLDIEETRAHIGADSLAYLPMEALHAELGEDSGSYCDACFSGRYPIPPRPGVDTPQLPLFRSEESDAV